MKGKEFEILQKQKSEERYHQHQSTNNLDTVSTTTSLSIRCFSKRSHCFFFTINTFYLTDSYIIFTLKMESVYRNIIFDCKHGLRTPREEKAFTARPKLHSHSQIFRYGGSIFCLPHRPNFSDIFDLCLHWVSVVRDGGHAGHILLLA